MTTTTTFDNKIAILSDLFVQYSGDEQFEDFFSYNDLGLPLAFAIRAGLAKSTDLTEPLINETFDLLLASISLEDTGFSDIGEILGFDE